MDGETGWNAAMLSHKKLENIASVIKDLDAEIVALQEVASGRTDTASTNPCPVRRTYEYAVIAEQALSPGEVRPAFQVSVLGKNEIAIGRASAAIFSK
ncbi:MAG: hypothetical protein R2875_15920 [Desulfobacterales bacterium]